MTVHFLIRGNIHSLTGGNLYNLHVIEGLEQNGYSVNIFGTDWPWTNNSDLENIGNYHFRKLAPGSCVVIDSLALASLHNVLPEFRERLNFIGLIHLPASYNLLYGAQGKLANEELAAFDNMNQLVVTGRFTYELMCNAGVTPEKIHIVEPGTEYYPQKQNYRKVPFKLLCISNYSAFKGQDLLIRSLQRLASRDWILNLHGDPDRDREFVAGVRAMIQELSLDKQVFVNGIIERDEISAALLDADLFVMPSMFETYGMALTESLAHGIPVVTTSAGNIPYTVPEGMGILTEPGNEEQLANEINSLFENPSKYSGLCNAASRYHINARTWPQAVSEFEKIILFQGKT